MIVRTLRIFSGDVLVGECTLSKYFPLEMLAYFDPHDEALYLSIAQLPGVPLNAHGVRFEVQ